MSQRLASPTSTTPSKPLQVYFSQGKAKVEIGLCRGKKLYDKRADIAKKDMQREAERDFKIRNLR